MSTFSLAVRDSDLHAYADGVLAPHRRSEVIAYLAAHPDDTERVLGWQRQNELLRAAFPPAAAQLVQRRPGPAPQAPAPQTPAPQTPAPLAARTLRPGEATRLAAGAGDALVRRRSAGAGVHAASLLVAGAVILLMAVQFAGGGAGLLDRLSPMRLAGFGPAPAAAVLPDGLTRRALEAHAVFAEDREVPVEFDAASTAQLAAYLSRRTGANVRTPNLTAQGLRLLGGRVLPLAEGTAAMLVYDGGAGHRAALTIARIAAAGEVGQRFQQAGSGAVRSVRWMAGDDIYVLTSEAGEAAILGLATHAAAAAEAAR